MNNIEKREFILENERLKTIKSERKILIKELYIKLIILLILLILIIVTSFNTGRKFYILKNTYLDSSKGKVNSEIARWNFNAKIIIRDEM